MTVRIRLFASLKERAGLAETTESVPPGCTLGELHDRLMRRFPALAPLRRSTLLAVGLEYQPREYVLQEGDEVALLPPVQGG